MKSVRAKRIRYDRFNLESQSESSAESDEDSNNYESDSSDHLKDDVCSLCGKSAPPKLKRKFISWVFCMRCKKWLHAFCEGIKEADLEESADYICKQCCSF